MASLIPRGCLRGDRVKVVDPSDGTITAGARSDSKKLRRPAIGIWAHADGDLRVLTADGDDEILPLKAGDILPLSIVQVFNTSSTLANTDFHLLTSSV